VILFPSKDIEPMDQDALPLEQAQDEILTSDVSDDALEVMADGPALSYTFAQFIKLDDSGE
jgi:hypothetical protein